MNQIESHKPLTIGILGYHTKLSFIGLYDLADDNEEQVEQREKNYIVLKDGTKIIPITYADYGTRRALKLDQLILFDDDRWLIEHDNIEAIQMIRQYFLCCSCVPEEYQIIKYEDVI